MEDKFIIKAGPREDFGDCVNFGELLLKRLKLAGDRIAQICYATGEKRTYEEIRQNIIKMAIALKDIGIEKGDVVSISSENCLEYPIFVCATFSIGAVVATLNPNYSEGETIHGLTLSKPKLIMCSTTSYKKLENILKNTESIKTILVNGGGVSSRENIILYEDLMNRQLKTEDFKVEPVDLKRHPLCILSSSGTTGLPKGVLLSHNNLIAIMHGTKELIKSSGLGPDDCILTVVPWFHSFGFITTIGCLFFNAKIVFMKMFQEEPFLKSIQEHKITMMFMVPPLMVFLAKHPLVNKYDLSSLKEIKCGAAPLSKEVQVAVSDRIGIKSINQAYGMTETTLAVLNSLPTDSTVYGSVGKIVGGMECKVIDDNNESLGPNQRGELCFRGETIMLGYLNNPKATADMIDKEGWLHTGDVGYYDDNYNFFIVDRIKELIKYKAFQVPPAELEALLLKHPSVKDAGVVGLPEESVGEIPIAFVVKQPNAELTEKEVIDFVAANVSNPKRLRGGVRFLNEIPKNPSGKILRRQLRQLLKENKSKL